MTETVSAQDPSVQSNSLTYAISDAVVALVRKYTGRGPSRARTSIRENVVVVMLEQSLSKVEQSLVGIGRGDTVLEIRREFHTAMREESSAKVAELTGRTVTAMLSANHLDPDLAAEIYVLDLPPDYKARGWENAPELTPGSDARDRRYLGSQRQPSSSRQTIGSPSPATPAIPWSASAQSSPGS